MIIFYLLQGCTVEVGDKSNLEPSFIKVTVDGEMGTTENLLPFSATPIQRTITVNTFDRNGDPYPFDGDLSLKIRPGRLDPSMQPKVSVQSGQWTGDISFMASFGPTRIWVTDEGDKFASSERVPTYATGISDTLHFMLPTIREMNETEDTETNHLLGEFTELRSEDRDIIATVVGTNGFWVTDLDDAPGNYSGMYIYTFQKPEAVVPGIRLSRINGGNQEYLGSTQLSFPSYDVDDTSIHPVPEATVISNDEACDPAIMESFESSLIKIESPEIPSTFTDGSIDYLGYLEYSQWPIKVGQCTIYVDSTVLSYAFDPLDMAGSEIEYVQGMVSQIWSKWVVLLVDDDGLPYDPESFPQRPSLTGPKQPLPRAKR